MSVAMSTARIYKKYGSLYYKLWEWNSGLAVSSSLA